MKFKKIILVGLILSKSLSSNILTDTTSLIEKMQTVSPEEKFELMNQIKSNIFLLNQNDRAEAIRQMRELRKNAKQAKMDKFKATLSPEELVAFEEKLKLKEEARKNYKARINSLRDGLSDEKKKGLSDFYKSKKRPLRKGGKKRMPGKKINSKVQTTLTAEQLEKFKNKTPHTRR